MPIKGYCKDHNNNILGGNIELTTKSYCRECHKIKNKKYRAKNKEKFRELYINKNKRRRGGANKDKFLSWQRNYYKNNRERKLLYDKEWRKKHKDKISNTYIRILLNIRFKYLNYDLMECKRLIIELKNYLKEV